jgi:hypothetical protein
MWQNLTGGRLNTQRVTLISATACMPDDFTKAKHSACVQAGLDRLVVVCLSQFVIDEIRALPNKPTLARLVLSRQINC